MTTVDEHLSVSGRSLAGWEIVSIISSFAIAEWITAAFAGAGKAIGAVPVVLALGFMIVSHRLRGESLRDLGFRFDNLFRGLALLLLPMLLAAGVCLVIARWFHSPIDFSRWHPSLPLALQLVLGLGWGLAQQYVLQGFINRRAQLIWGSGWVGILLVAAIFSALHLPNPALVAATLVGGVIWAAIYQRVPNLFALALSHCLMTWVLVATIPPSALQHLRIGFRYFG
jgi:membrane protease YdiL (CAAX protease family)